MKKLTKTWISLAAAGLIFCLSGSAFAASESDFSVCFSPGGNCDAKLISFAKSAHSTLDIAIYDLTLSTIASTIAGLNNSGLQIRVVCDRSEAQTKTSYISKLVSAGVAIKYGNVKGIMHNKFMIVDGHMLETGSYNYTSSATSFNAENQIYLDSPEVVSQYQSQFEKLWAQGIPIQ